MKRIIVGCIAAVALFAAGACSADSTPPPSQHDQNSMDNQLSIYQHAGQDVPQFQWSQYRQTLIDIESAQANGIATTSFFFNLGVHDPIDSCPSLGYPLASTSELTNPQQTATGSNDRGYGITSIGQMDPTGVFTGASSGSYVVCVVDGIKSIEYWEGDVRTVGGPAHWDGSHIVRDGAPTVVTGKK